MFGTVVRQLPGFGKFRHGFPRGHAETEQSRENVIRLEPVGRNLPEKRSQSMQLTETSQEKISLIFGSQSSSGTSVSETSALGVGAVVACVQILSVMTAKLPIYLYKSSKKGPIHLEKHPITRLLGKGTSGLHTNFELRSLMQTGCGLGGNGYARVYRDSTYTPAELEWVKPCDIQPQLYKSDTGRKSAKYLRSDEKGLLTRADVIHVRSPICLDGLIGMSPVRMLRESIGTALSQTEAAGRLMKNGAQFPGIMKVEGNLKPEQLTAIRDEINANLSGTINAGRIPVVNGSMSFMQTNGMSMVDAQFAESRKMELHEVARHYGIPAFMVDSTATSTWGAGIEQQMLGFMNLSLDSWLVNWEQCLEFTLLTEEEKSKGYYLRFDRNQLANASLEARAKFYQAMRSINVYSPNDIRRMEDEPAISKEDGGDDYSNPNVQSPNQSAPSSTKEPADVEDNPKEPEME